MLLICFRTSYVSISKSTTHPRPALGQTSASPTTSPSAGQVQSVAAVQQCNSATSKGFFCPFVFGICVWHLFKNCEVSSSSPFRDFTPSRLEKVECFSFKLQLHCTGTMKDACMLLRLMLQKMNCLNSNEMTFVKVEVEDGARLLIEKVLVSASAACGAKTLTASLELVQGYHYFESLALQFCDFLARLSGSQLHSWRVEFWGSPQKNMNLLEVQFHKIVEFQRQDMYVYIYIVTIVTILIHNYTS